MRLAAPGARSGLCAPNPRARPVLRHAPAFGARPASSGSSSRRRSGRAGGVADGVDTADPAPVDDEADRGVVAVVGPHDPGADRAVEQHRQDLGLGASRVNGRSRLATFFAPTTGLTTAWTTPPPSATSTTSGASTSISPCRSPSVTAARNRSTTSCCSRRLTSIRGRRAATCSRARCPIWRTAAADLPITLSDLAVGHVEHLSQHEHRALGGGVSVSAR